jgi:hypothetical protein
MTDNFNHSDDLKDYLEQNEKLEEMWRKKYQKALLKHPDCSDPDHPGCEHCGDAWGGEEG